jgi:hypothetical protein
MTTKTVRSRFSHEVGEQVEGCRILERKVIIPPEPSQRRLGVYDYLVEVPPAPPAPAKRESPPRSKSAATARSSAPERGSFTRATPEEMASGVIRRLPSR